MPAGNAEPAKFPALVACQPLLALSPRHGVPHPVPVTARTHVAVPNRRARGASSPADATAAAAAVATTRAARRPAAACHAVRAGAAAAAVGRTGGLAWLTYLPGPSRPFGAAAAHRFAGAFLLAPSPCLHLQGSVCWHVACARPHHNHPACCPQGGRTCEATLLAPPATLQGGLQPSRGSKVWSLSSSSSRVWGGSDDGGLLGGAPPQSPLRDYGPPVAAQLTRRCAKARKLLGRLQQPVLSLADGGPRPPLPNAALRFCRVCWGWGPGAVGAASVASASSRQAAEPRRGHAAGANRFFLSSCTVRESESFAVVHSTAHASGVATDSRGTSRGTPAACPALHLPLSLQGLAFVRQRKAGVLGALNWGYALLIARLADGSW